MDEAQDPTDGQQVTVRKPAGGFRLGIAQRAGEQHDESHRQNYPVHGLKQVSESIISRIYITSVLVLFEVITMRAQV